MLFRTLFSYIWVEFGRTRTPDLVQNPLKMSDSHRFECALVQANPVATSPLDFKLACDINTERMHCSICWLQLEFKALALTCNMLNVLELLA